jgi:hypothetical protein
MPNLSHVPPRNLDQYLYCSSGSFSGRKRSFATGRTRPELRPEKSPHPLMAAPEPPAEPPAEPPTPCLKTPCQEILDAQIENMSHVAA